HRVLDPREAGREYADIADQRAGNITDNDSPQFIEKRKSVTQEENESGKKNKKQYENYGCHACPPGSTIIGLIYEMYSSSEHYSLFYAGCQIFY
ncbi:MAG TPA: hypothetical protein PKI31_11530, partial [Spirochaetota bacterium]|nr:hypothetical protein [Spirochaetota bacterium]